MLVGRERGIEALEQVVRDALLLAQQRAAIGFGGMRGEYRLDRQTLDEIERLGERPAVRLQSGDCVLDAAGLRPLAVLEEVVAAAPDAMHLLGEIDRLEPGGEGPHQVARQRRRPVAHACGELRPGVALAGAPTDRGHPVQLHQLEQLLAALLAQDLADQGAERVHIVAQRRVLGGELDVAAVHP